jgi:hypothetical protein
MKLCTKHPACCVRCGVREPGCAEYCIWANDGNRGFDLLGECHSPFSAHSDVNRKSCWNCVGNVSRLTTCVADFADRTLEQTALTLVLPLDDFGRHFLIGSRATLWRVFERLDLFWHSW